MLAASLDTSAGGFVNGRTRKPCATNLYFRCTIAGAVAQLGERLVRNEEVRGSIPLGSTTASPDTVAIFWLWRAVALRVWGDSSARRGSCQAMPCHEGYR